MATETLDAPETSVELLREFERTGRPEPFELFMRRHASMVYATCLKVTRDPHDAEDATQATFLTLASKSRLNGEIRQPEAWLRKVAHRLALDLIRSKKRRVNRENLRSEMNSEAAPLDSHDHADSGEVKGILNEELAKMPASYRMPLILHYFGGLSRDEMAEQLKLKPSTLGVRLHRAREQLRRKLAARGILLPTVALTALLSDVVRQSVCGHMMTSTAQQASAIALGHAAMPQMFAASTGVDSIGSLLSMLSHGKLKILLTAAILGTAISMTSAQVRLLLPEVIRNALPTIRMPSWSMPRFEFAVPAPRLSAVTPKAVEHGEASPALIATIVAPARAALARSVIAGVEVADRIAASGDHFARSNGTASAPATVAAAEAERAGAQVKTSRLIQSSAFGTSTHLSTAMAALSSATIHASSASPVVDEARTDAPLAAPIDGWGEVIADESSTSAGAGGGGGPPLGDLFRNLPNVGSVPRDLPTRVVATVTGPVPQLRDGSGTVAGRHQAPPLKSNAASGAVGASVEEGAKPAKTSRTVVFNGTSANYGGYADADWKATQLNQVSQLTLDGTDSALSHLQAGETPSATASTAPGFSFNYPAIPGETLSVNGARATLNNAAGISNAPATISFVEPTSTKIPALPTEHHFIDVWSLDTTVTFDSVDLLVRYDDLRAARLGLNERILKLWVSDGKSWSLLWRDPTFGRDIDQNLMWVTAGSDVKFFAASAPEPATLAMLVGGIGMLASRRRRPLKSPYV